MASDTAYLSPVPGVELRFSGMEAAADAVSTPSQVVFHHLPERSLEPQGGTDNRVYVGDNLDVLKTLRTEFASGVKLIYIDPPYNTGDPWVYADGRSSGEWLSFMYPRLVLARELLRSDGTIFISIGEEEIATLRLLCDAVFGAANRISVVSWQRRHNQPNDKSKMVAQVAEFLLVYAKDAAALRKARSFRGVPLSEERRADYTNPDGDPRGPWTTKPWKAGSGQSGSAYTITTPTGATYEGLWLGARETFDKLLADGRIFFTRGGDGIPRKKIYLSERDAEGQPATNFWDARTWGHNQEATEEQAALFGGVRQVFTSPKPVRLCQRIVGMAAPDPGDVVLDFFAGSGSTAEAVWRQSAKDGVSRRVVLAQLDEPVNPRNRAEGAAASLGFSTIDEILEGRLRRVAIELPELAHWRLLAAATE